MEQIIEFTANHPLLIGSLIALVSALFFTEKRKGGQSVSSHELTRLVNQRGAVIVDVREKADFSKGHIVDALHIPFSKLKERTGELNNHKEKPIIIVDAMGQHSGSAVKALKETGFADVMKLKGGISTWQADSLPLTTK